MKRILCIVLLAVGCNRGKEQAATSVTPETPAAKAREEDHLLHIDPEMLRDLRITTAKVESRGGGEGVNVLGELRVNENSYAEVGSAISGRVVRLLAAPGDRLRAGQPLAELQSPEIGKLRAEYIGARARAELARKTLERKRGLATDRIVAQREVQEAESNAAAAEGDLRSSAATLRAMGVSPDALDGDASRLVLRSPIAGVVIERTAAVGQLTEPSKPLFRVGDLSRLWLTVHAFERDAVRIKTGGSARVTFPALPGKTFTGTITNVGKLVDTTSRTIPVRIDVLNSEGVLRPGMSATAWVVVGDETGRLISVPTAALQRFQDGWTVFIPHGEDAFEIRQVGRGRDLGGAVEIVSGLKPGDTVAVEGAFLLKAEAEKSRGEGEHHEH